MLLPVTLPLFLLVDAHLERSCLLGTSEASRRARADGEHYYSYQDQSLGQLARSARAIGLRQV